jgi:RNA polymerase sigma-70 factor (ECF subfamily)
MKTNLPIFSATAPSTASEKAQQSRTEAAVDAALVRRFVGGDEAAFVEIMERYRAKIFTVAFSLLHSHGDAEEITQDTFIRAYRGLAKFRGDSSLVTWLYRIAVNLARNRYWFFFRRRRHATISLDRPIGEEQDATVADLIAADAPDPAQESARAEFVGLVSQCLEQLDQRHREVLNMRNTMLLPYDEIAAALGVNIGTVKSRIARARENLRALLTAQCPEFDGGSRPDDYFPPARASGRLSCAAA